LLVGDHRLALRERMLALVPENRSHSLRRGGAGGRGVSTTGATSDEFGLLRFEAGDSAEASLHVVCGRVDVLYRAGVRLFELLEEPVVLDFGDSDEMTHTFDRLLLESRRHEPGARAMLKALMNECLVMVFRELCDSPDCTLPWLSALENPSMAAVLREVLADPGEPHSVESLADTAAMSRSAFAREFRGSFGQSPMAYVRMVRLRTAADLLSTTDLTISAAARRVGYSSRSHFSRAFTEAFGQPPSEFRDGPTSVRPHQDVASSGH
ncbi:MAG: helix-turn-helix transcriptional regulator, partial [Nitriliruptorales bacterium]|nr:helix-turn-helix transcriptional regulator [Nitriliruptorales bacterium]